MSEQFASAIVEAIASATQPLHQRLKVLEAAAATRADIEQRIAAIEAALGIGAEVSRLDDIEARLTAIEAAVSSAPAIKFFGPWRDGIAYPIGAIVQRKHLYIATEAVPAGVIPGVDDRDDAETARPWRTCVRAGKAGKDGVVPTDWERRLRALEHRL